MRPARFQPPVYADLSTVKLMRISADINEEWAKRKLLDLNAPTEISQALGIRSPGQLEIELSRLDREVKALRGRVAELFAFVLACKRVWDQEGGINDSLYAEATRLTQTP